MLVAIGLSDQIPGTIELKSENKKEYKAVECGCYF